MVFWLQGINWAESEPARKRCDSKLHVASDMVWTPSQLTNWSTISSLMLSFSAFSCHLDNPYSKSASRPSTVSMTTWTSAQLHLSPYPPMACSSSAEPWPNSQSDCVYILSSTPSLSLWCMALADSLVRNLYSQQCFNFFSKQNMNRIVISHSWGQGFVQIPKLKHSILYIFI